VTHQVLAHDLRELLRRVVRIAEVPLEAVNEDGVVDAQVDKDRVKALVRHRLVPGVRAARLVHLRLDRALDWLVEHLGQIQIVHECSCKRLRSHILLVTARIVEGGSSVSATHARA